MTKIANTPIPPYYAVIFTNLRTPRDDGYAETSRRMVELAEEHPGCLGVESARDGLGITLSYWKDEASIQSWKGNMEHVEAQQKGRAQWYASFKIRIAKVERDYGMNLD